MCGLRVVGDEEEEEKRGRGEVAFGARPTRTRTTTTRWPDRDAIPEIKQREEKTDSGATATDRITD